MMVPPYDPQPCIISIRPKQDAMHDSRGLENCRHSESVRMNDAKYKNELQLCRRTPRSTKGTIYERMKITRQTQKRKI
jgi:hypothetical protein